MMGARVNCWLVGGKMDRRDDGWLRRRKGKIKNTLDDQ